MILVVKVREKELPVLKMASNRVKIINNKKQQEQQTKNKQDDQMRVFVRIKPDEEGPNKP